MGIGKEKNPHRHVQWKYLDDFITLRRHVEEVQLQSYGI